MSAAQADGAYLKLDGAGQAYAMLGEIGPVLGEIELYVHWTCIYNLPDHFTTAALEPSKARRFPAAIVRLMLP